jgi:hypothetical protein
MNNLLPESLAVFHKNFDIHGNCMHGICEWKNGERTCLICKKDVTPNDCKLYNKSK